MELGNNAIQIYREGVAFTMMELEGVRPSTRCLQEYSRLSDCVLQNRLNVLDGDSNYAVR